MLKERSRFTMSAIKYPIGTRWKMRDGKMVDIFPWHPDDPKAPFEGQVDGHSQRWDKDGNWVKGNFGSNLYDLIEKVSDYVTTQSFSPDIMKRRR